MNVPMVAEPGLIPDTMGLAVNKVFAIRTYEHDEENNISEIKFLQVLWHCYLLRGWRFCHGGDILLLQFFYGPEVVFGGRLR